MSAFPASHCACSAVIAAHPAPAVHTCRWYAGAACPADVKLYIQPDAPPSSSLPAASVRQVASCNLQDFYNLVDVYLDAVFHPKCGCCTPPLVNRHSQLANGLPSCRHHPAGGVVPGAAGVWRGRFQCAYRSGASSDLPALRSRGCPPGAWRTRASLRRRAGTMSWTTRRCEAPGC